MIHRFIDNHPNFNPNIHTWLKENNVTYFTGVVPSLFYVFFTFGLFTEKYFEKHVGSLYIVGKDDATLFKLTWA